MVRAALPLFLSRVQSGSEPRAPLPGAVGPPGAGAGPLWPGPRRRDACLDTTCMVAQAFDATGLRLLPGVIAQNICFLASSSLFRSQLTVLIFARFVVVDLDDLSWIQDRLL